MKKKPHISILLPVFNFTDVMPTINSILCQSYTNFELIICDDGSSPKMILPDLNDKRIKILYNKKNIGLGPTLNRLLECSHNESKYFATIEQDDIYKPYYINDCLKFLENNSDYGLVSGISEFWDGEKVRYNFPGIIAAGEEYPFGVKMFLINYRNQIKVAQTCMVVRKKVHYDNSLIFSKKYSSLSVDWDYILRFSLISKIKGIKKVFVRQDRRKERLSLTTKHNLAGQIVRELLKDFSTEFGELISFDDYRYALSTQIYVELGNLKYISRIKSILFTLVFLDPDKKRVFMRIKKEVFNIKLIKGIKFWKK